jgi:hypothetical protein
MNGIDIAIRVYFNVVVAGPEIVIVKKKEAMISRV